MGALALKDQQIAKEMSAWQESIALPSKKLTDAMSDWVESMALPSRLLASSVATLSETLALPTMDFDLGLDDFAVQSLPTFTIVKARPKPTVGEWSESEVLLERDPYADWSVDKDSKTEDLLLDDGTYERLSLFDTLITDEGLRKTCRKLFLDGHSMLAVEQAFKYVNNMVKRKSGLSGSDGADLMRTAFSANSPVLFLNAFQSNSDESEQRGYMDIFAGSITRESEAPVPTNMIT